MTLLLTALSAAFALPPVPAELEISQEEAASLADSEVVVRYRQDGSISMVDVAATPAATMAAVMDLPARIDDIGALKSADVYLDTPGQMGARWELGITVYSVSFHTRYDYDLALGWCVYGLDPDKDNGIDHAKGSYQVYASGAGSRIVYRAEAAVEGGGPEWLRKRLAYGSAQELLLGIKRRAEAG